MNNLYETLIVKLLEVSSVEEFAKLFDNNRHLFTPYLYSQLQDRISINSPNYIFLNLAEISIRSTLVINFLKVPNNERLTMIEQNSDWLFSDKTYDYIQTLKQGCELNSPIRVLINEGETVLIENCVRSYLLSEDTQYQNELFCKAFSFFESDLVLNREPKLWASFQHSNSNILLRKDGEEKENLGFAILALQRALSIFTKKDTPWEWAHCNNNLGYAYLKRGLGHLSNDIEHAITAFLNTLSVFEQSNQPELWAMSNHYLATAYCNRIEGNLENNVEFAINAFHEALSIHTEQSMPYNWAISQNGLGLAYEMRPKEHKAENIERSIEAFNNALKIYPEGSVDWAMSITNLGNAHRVRVLGNRAENIDSAITLIEKTFKVLTQEKKPIDWANNRRALGLAYQDRINGDRAENIEKAIESYQQALLVQTKESMAMEWARTQNNLGNAYRSRIRGNNKENVETAIKAYQQALCVFQKETSSYHWAIIHNNIGISFLERKEGDTEEAINAFQNALIVFNEEATPYEWATVHYNLSDAYRSLTHGNRSKNIELAINSLQKAIRIRTQSKLPYEWAMSQHSLARLHLDRGDIDLAINCLWNALQIYTPDTYPSQCRQIAASCGGLLLDKKKLIEAYSAFKIAHLAAENERQQVNRSQSREKIAQETVQLYSELVYVCLLLGEDSAAFEYTLIAKGRTDSDRLNSSQSFTELIQQYPEIKESYLYILGLQQVLEDFDLTSANVYSELISDQLYTNVELQYRMALNNDKIHQTRNELRKAFEDLSYRFPLATSLQFTPPLKKQKIQELAGTLNATLIEYFRHNNGWVAFIISNNTLDCVELPELTAFLQENSFTLLINYQKGISYNEDLSLKELYHQLVTPIEPYFLNSEQLIVSSTSVLSGVPFGAMWSERTNERLTDRYPITTTPSLTFLHNIYQQHQLRLRQTEQHTKRQLLSVVYPGNDPLDVNYLHNVVKEAEAAALSFDETIRLYHQNAQPQRIIDLCNKQSFSAIHFGCHGFFEADEPEYSRLLLNGTLTVQQIISNLRLHEDPLVTLGACQTGLAHSSLSGDLIGLTQAFLIVGADTVISSLWSVDDEATSVFFEAFYRKYKEENLTVAQVLQHAQLQVRQNPQWREAFYWAAFQVVGLPI